MPELSTPLRACLLLATGQALDQRAHFKEPTVEKALRERLEALNIKDLPEHTNLVRPGHAPEGSLLAWADSCLLPEALSNDPDAKPGDTPLRKPVFHAQASKAEQAPNQACFHPQLPLSFAQQQEEGPAFPATAPESPDLTGQLQALEQALRDTRAHSPEAFLQTAQFWLEHYTWGLADEQDAYVNPVHMLRSRIALTQCLAQYYLQAGAAHQAANVVEQLTAPLASQPDPNEQPFLLIGGDLSGIQKFIYQIASTKAAKSLKGRSFYVEILLRGIVAVLQQRLGLSPEHLVYSSGGGFYLLAPNTQAIINELKTVSQQLEQALLDKHGTSIYLALASAEFSIDTCQTGNIQRAWQALSEKLNKQKRRRYADLLANGQFERFFGEHHPELQADPNATADAVTGELITGKAFNLETERSVQGDTAGINVISGTTLEQIQVGRKVKEADRWAIEFPYDQSSGHLDFSTRFPLLKLPDQQRLAVALLAEKDLNQSSSSTQVRPNNLKPDPSTSSPQALGFYAGIAHPQVQDEQGYMRPKEFSELAKPEPEGELERLGILRMDVDSLGQLFINGFRGANTFARYSCLSQSLEYFFAGYLGQVVKNDEDYSEHCQIIYAGGDDLFIVGRWNKIIQLANRIQCDFQRWTGQHPALSLSGGAAIVQPKFPISYAAELAKEGEEAAKHHHTTVKGQEQTLEKNSFTLLGQPLHWQHEFPVVQQLKHDLVCYINGGDINGSYINGGYFNRALLTKIAQHYQEKHTQHKGSARERWRWLLAYDLGRFIQRLPKPPEDQADDPAEPANVAKAWLQAQQNAAVTDWLPTALPGYSDLGPLPEKADYLGLLTLAARWAELTLRTTKQSNNSLESQTS